MKDEAGRGRLVNADDLQIAWQAGRIGVLPGMPVAVPVLP